MTIAAILLAAGRSARMGTPKPLLVWQGQTLVEYQCQQLKGLPVDQLVVVLGHRADDVRPLVNRIGDFCVINELYDEGRASSVRVGAAAVSEETAIVLVLNVDQPRPVAMMQRLLDEHRKSDTLITVPTHKGERGHPAIFAGSLLPAMRDVREETQGLRDVVTSNERHVLEVEFASSVVLLDLNKPDQYETALKSYPKEVIR
ncbi:MAG: nucleotidyltransferase family protein [Chloroflexi bacterium]|nr:nucleotidyltransferase family protein [Chloroflexota bacterium]